MQALVLMNVLAYIKVYLSYLINLPIEQLTYNYYKDDASQYDEEHSLKIRRIYDLMPSYMENKVKRIKFKQIENIKDSSLL